MATEVLARGKRQGLSGDAYKAAHDAAMTALLTRYRSSYSRRAAKIELLKFLLPIYIFASCVVDGAYDLGWQTGLNLYLLGGLFILIGIGVPRWFIRRAKRKQYRTSAGTWKFVGLLVVLLGVFYIVSGIALHQTDNYHLWHTLMSNKEDRDNFGRNGLEGVYTGILLVYFRWDPVAYQLKGSFADRAFKNWWPNSRQPDEQVPLRSWMIWAWVAYAAAITALTFFIGWELNNLVTSHADLIHHWLQDVTPRNWHTPIPGFLETKVNNFVNKFTGHWWVWLAGFVGGRFLARVPAKGIINTLQEDSAQRRLSKKGGNLDDAFSGLRSFGYNAHVALAYYGYATDVDQVAASFCALSGHELEPDSVTITEINLALHALPEKEAKDVDLVIARAAEAEVEARDPGVRIPLEIAVALSPLLFLLGLFYVYTPLANALFKIHLPVLTHNR